MPKIEKLQFSAPYMEPKGVANPIVSIHFLAKRDHAHFWHENNSVGQYLGENEICKLFSFCPPFGIFIAKYRQMTPH